MAKNRAPSNLFRRSFQGSSKDDRVEEPLNLKLHDSFYEITDTLQHHFATLLGSRINFCIYHFCLIVYLTYSNHISTFANYSTTLSWLEFRAILTKAATKKLGSAMSALKNSPSAQPFSIATIRHPHAYYAFSSTSSIERQSNLAGIHAPAQYAESQYCGRSFKTH